MLLTSDEGVVSHWVRCVSALVTRSLNKHKELTAVYKIKSFDYIHVGLRRLSLKLPLLIMKWRNYHQADSLYRAALSFQAIST
jgi:hypothetical protein